MAALVAEGFRAEPTVASFDTTDTGTTVEVAAESTSDFAAAPAEESASSPSADFAAPAVEAADFPAGPSTDFADVLPDTGSADTGSAENS